jgi:parallel beta-helix repeat protein
VTASNAQGSGTATSAQTSVIASGSSGAWSGSVGTSLPARLGTSSGQQYYVNGQSGSDSASGSISSPWRTIGHAWSSVPAGSIINVRAGTYSGSISLMGRSFGASNPVTLRAYPGESVTLRTSVYIAETSGVRVEGFQITNPSGDGIKISDAADIEILNNTVSGCGNQGILVVGNNTSGRTYSSNVQIWSNRIYGNGANGSSMYNHAVYYGGAGNDNDGIRHGTVGGVIANNVFYDQPTGYHLQIGPQADGLIVTNNTFTTASSSNPNTGTAIIIWGLGNQFSPRNIVVANNALAYNANMGVHGSGSGPAMSTNVVRSNLGFANPNGDFVPQYGSSTVFTLGSGNVSGQDPRFVDRGSRNFRPQAASPLIDKADPAYAPATDASGKARVNRPDIGAFEG